MKHVVVCGGFAATCRGQHEKPGHSDGDNPERPVNSAFFERHHEFLLG